MAFNVSKAFDHEKDHNTYKPGTTDVKPYSFDYSELAKAVATIIESNYTDVNFTIFETRQFNEFMNLQIGKNTLMVSVVKLRRNFMKTHLFFPDPDHQPKILVIPFATLFRGSSKCPPSFHSKYSFSTFGSSLRISACLRVLSPTFAITLFFVFSSRSPRLI